MNKNKVLLLSFAIVIPALISAQTREPGTTQARDAQPVQQTGGIASPSAVSYSTDALSTSISGARIALGAGDLLEVTVFDTPELTQKVRVNSEGKIELALIGEIDVEGISPDALGRQIRAKLIVGHFVKDPQVSIFVSEYAGQMVYVNGEVNRPGAYPLLRSHHLEDLIAVAGGLSARAGSSVTIKHEGVPAPSAVIDLSDKDENLRNPEIVAGDSITVSQAGIVYVVGDVARPGGFLLDRRTTLSVAQAVALAEGTNPSASIRKTRLLRASGGNRQEIPVDLKLVLKAESPDPQLQSGDILYIPPSTFRGMGRQTLQTILSGTLSGIAIYSAGHF
ncbi:MAG: polysaccharide biosynthesis/export family protein [Terracidiphilus sp.]